MADSFREQEREIKDPGINELLDKLGGPMPPRRLNVRNVSAGQFGHLIRHGPDETADRFKRPDLGDTAVPRTAHGRMAIQTEPFQRTPVTHSGNIGDVPVGWSLPWNVTRHFEDPQERQDRQW